MGPRKRLPKEEAVKTFNDSIDGYIHPPKFRDGNVKITIYSSLLQLAEVRDWLSVDQQAIFKGTAIGHLLSVPAESKYSGTILHFLLSREIHVDDKPDEMHFKVGGKILHFGKREFALVTGLSFKKPEKDFVPPPKSSSLMWTHFPNQYRVTGLEVKALLFKKNSTCPSLDRVKLALLLVVHRFLMGCPDRDAINISYWHLVDDLEEFNKYPWGEATFGRLTKFRSPLLYQANKENSGVGGETKYKVVGIAHALSVWALDIMPGLLNLCGRKIESIGWLPHMLCVLCTQSPKYPSLRTLEMNDVHVRSDIMWQKGDANQLIVLGLEEGTPEIEVELSSSFRTEKERHGYHGVKDSHGRDVPKGNMSSCSQAKTTGIESLEVVELVEDPVDATMDTSSSKGLTRDSTLLNISTSINVIPSPPGFTRASAPERVEGFQLVDDFKILEEHVILYKKIYEKHGHMATKKVIKFNDDMLLTCVTSLLKIISAMENVRGSELSEALLDRWEGFIKDADTLEFNIEWLREGFHRIKNHWRSSFGIDREVEIHADVLDAMQVKYDCLSTREDELNAELLEVKVQKRKAEATISSERDAIQEKVTKKNKLGCEPVLGIVLS
ncbi:uncharacterized protein LOC113323945 [Papaver somniferum]|uniref:uncharacterized protein LOC113323945 n=1 Tax=Papaver somniferum TaxID=3469 RepID=UPI000E701B34|nr:uncharacterized protein LOC113323945 [Papaver somniferum]